MASNEKEVEAPTPAKSLHLITELEFGSRFLQSTLFLGVFFYLVDLGFRQDVISLYLWSQEMTLTTAHRYALWSVVGLLSSSCCALQLLLNALSMGCAGWNALGPYRPFFLSLTMYLQVGAWYAKSFLQSASVNQSTTRVGMTLWVILLSLSPEILVFWNYVFHNFQKNECQRLSSEDAPRKLHFRMDSVGCAACLTSVHHVMESFVKRGGISKSSQATHDEACPAILDYAIMFEESRLTVTIAQSTIDKSGSRRTQSAILQALEDAGFPAIPI